MGAALRNQFLSIKNEVTRLSGQPLLIKHLQYALNHRNVKQEKADSFRICFDLAKWDQIAPGSLGSDLPFSSNAAAHFGHLAHGRSFGCFCVAAGPVSRTFSWVNLSRGCSPKSFLNFFTLPFQILQLQQNSTVFLFIYFSWHT